MRSRYAILIALLAVALSFIALTHSPLAQGHPVSAAPPQTGSSHDIVAVSTGGNYVNIWNAATGQLKNYKLAGSPNGKLILTWPGVIGLFDDETYLYVVFDNYNVQQYTVTTGQLIASWQLNP